jgi:hypothetical protein
MTARKPLYSSEEFARRGQEIYDRDVRPALGPEDEDKFVAIDIQSGGYEIDRDDYAATERLLRRQPDAQIWLARVGQRAAYRIGAAFARGGDAARPAAVEAGPCQPPPAVQRGAEQAFLVDCPP